jgi:hypothetical protein
MPTEEEDREWQEYMEELAAGGTAGDSLRYQPVYDVTEHRLPASLLDDRPLDVSVTREALHPYFHVDDAFILHNVLSEAECARVIAYTQEREAALRTIDCSQRVVRRLSAMGEEFAEKLFRRVQDFMAPVHVTVDASALGVDTDAVACGRWTAAGLNPCFRICHYSPGGFFQPHIDGGFEVDCSHRSIKTFMIYLNDGFHGGTTNFFNDKQLLYQAPKQENIVSAFTPKVGSCLVFNSGLLHDGGRLMDTGPVKQKWIFRSEVMYKKQ